MYYGYLLSEEMLSAKAFTDPVKSIRAIRPLFWDLSVLNMCSGTYDLKLQHPEKYALFAV